MTTSRAALALALAIAVAGCSDDDDPTGPSTPELRHLLVVTHTEGFRHASIPTAEQTLAELAAASGGSYDVTFCRNAAEVASMLTRQGLAGFDGVVFANTSARFGGSFSLPDPEGFLDWIRAGHPFIGTHSASDTFHGDAFVDMLGGEFFTHGAQCEVDIRVEEPSHPASAPIAPTYRVFDEIYEFTDNPRGRVSVLLSLDTHPPDGHADQGQPGDFVLAWHKSYGQGRVFYTALGHREEVWLDSGFRAHLGGGIEWALEGVAASSAPSSAAVAPPRRVVAPHRRTLAR